MTGETSERKAEANRRNAQLSTGPRTPAGKKRVAQNALKHGIFTRKMIVLDEKPRDFLKVWRQFHDEYRPVGATEKLLVERIASSVWRLRRMGRVEADVLALKEGDGSSNHRYGMAFLGDTWGPGPGAMPRLSRYEVALERSLHRSFESLRKAQEARNRRDLDAKSHELDAKSHELDAGFGSVSGRSNGAQVPPRQANGGG